MDKKKYPILAHDIPCFFATDSPWDNIESMQSAFDRGVLKNAPRLELFKAELLKLFAEPDVDWLNLCINDDYEIWLPDPSSENARAFIIENIWNNVFPDMPVPEPVIKTACG